MCCFSLPVRHVAKTRIYARASAPLPASVSPRQLLVYSMSLVADEDLAMVLPIPVPPSSPEDAVRFVDLSRCPKFFDEVDVLFPPELTRGGFGELAAGFAPQVRSLVVHDVGDFEASFVPRVADFERLDARFRLPSQVWDSLPGYADWGFCVFKLRAAASSHGEAQAAAAGHAQPTPPAPGVIGRVRQFFAGKGTDAPSDPPARDYHPMAFEFPRRDASRLFFPTVHVHDGIVHETASFDHTLYCQVGTTRALDADWRRSSAPAGLVTGLAREWLDLDAHVHKRQMIGTLPNRDTLVADRA
jgi:hypothetical protein